MREATPWNELHLDWTLWLALQPSDHANALFLRGSSPRSGSNSRNRKDSDHSHTLCNPSLQPEWKTDPLHKTYQQRCPREKMTWRGVHVRDEDASSSKLDCSRNHSDNHFRWATHECYFHLQALPCQMFGMLCRFFLSCWPPFCTEAPYQAIHFQSNVYKEVAHPEGSHAKEARLFHTM